MPDISAFVKVAREIFSRRAGCWTPATPEGRKRLLALTVALLAPAVLPPSADAQQSATGSVRLVVQADQASLRELEADSRAILWMAPESIEKARHAARLWAEESDDAAAAAWRELVGEEAQAGRLRTPDQAEAAAEWVATLAVSSASQPATRSASSPLHEESGNKGENPLYERGRSIQRAAHDAAMVSLRNVR